MNIFTNSDPEDLNPQKNAKSNPKPSSKKPERSANKTKKKLQKSKINNFYPNLVKKNSKSTQKKRT